MAKKLEDVDLHVNAWSGTNMIGLPGGVEITHIPTGLVVHEEGHSSSWRNRAVAMKRLGSMVANHQEEVKAPTPGKRFKGLELRLVEESHTLADERLVMLLDEEEYWITVIFIPTVYKDVKNKQGWGIPEYLTGFWMTADMHAMTDYDLVTGLSEDNWIQCELVAGNPTVWQPKEGEEL